MVLPPRVARGTGPVTALTMLRVAGRLTLARGGADGVALLDVESGGLVGHLDAGSAAPVQALTSVADEREEWPLLAVGGVDGVLRLWDVARQQQVAETPLGSGAITALATVPTPDGPLLAGLCGRQLRVWRCRDGQPYELGSLAEPLTALCTVRLPGRVLLATGDAGGALRLWDPRTVGVSRILALAHRGSVRALTPCLVGGAIFLASSGADRVLRLWRLPTRESGPLDGPAVESPPVPATIRQLVTIRTAEGELLVSGSTAGSVELWRPDPHRLINVRSLSEHAGEIWAVQGIRDGDRVVIASGDATGEVRLVDLRAGEAAATPIPRAPGSTLWSLATVPGADLLATAGADGVISVVDLGTSTVRRSLTGHRGTVRALAAGPDPRTPTLVSGGTDGTIRLWDPVAGQQRALLTAEAGEVSALASLRWRGRDAVISASANGTVRLWRSGRRPETLLDGAGEITCLAVVPATRGTLVACGGPTGLRLVELRRRRRVVHEVSTLATTALAPVVFGNRALLLCAQDDGDILVLDPAIRAVIGALARPQGSSQVDCLAAIPRAKGPFIAGGCRDGRILTWHGESGTLLGTVSAHIGAVRAVEITADGAELRSVGDDGRLCRWSLTGPSPRLSGEVRLPSPPEGTLASQRRSPQSGRADRLGHTNLVAALHELITDPRTPVPVVLGVHGEWGQGKTSVLLQVRALLDPCQIESGWGNPATPTHELTPRDASPTGGRWPARSFRRLARWWRGGPVRTRLTPLWVWRQTRRVSAAVPYRIRPLASDQQHITVWFNPRRYPSGNHVWAGLSREIFDAITRRLPPDQRERLWFDVNLRHGDPTALRRWVQAGLVRALVGSIAGLATAGLIAMGAVRFDLLSGGPVIALASAGAALPLALLAAAFGRDLRRRLPAEALDGPVPGGVRPPSRGRDSHYGDPLRHTPPDLLHHHLRTLLALACEDTPIVVFIDDLDRCAPDVVAETVEALNLFVDGALGRCVFVLALDPAAVAAHIEEAHETRYRRIESDKDDLRPLRHLGWQALERLIELPIRLPGLSADDVNEYLDELIQPAALGPAPMSASASWAETEVGSWIEPQIPRQRSPIDDLPSMDGPPVPDDLPSAIDALLRSADVTPPQPSPDDTPDRPTAPPPPVSADSSPGCQLPRDRIPTQRRGDADTAGPWPPRLSTAETLTVADTAAQIAYVERIMEVQRELRETAMALPRRGPRHVTCLLHLWRFYMSLEYRAGRLPARFRDLARHGRAMARFVGIVMRFPRLLDSMATPSPATFRQLMAAADDDTAWREALERLCLSELDPAVRELREVLREPTATDQLLADLAERYL